MSNYTVTCPKCQHSFEPTDAIREEVEKELRGKMTDWQKKKEEETNQLLAEQKTKLQTEITEQLKKNIASDYEHKIKLMQENETKMQQQANEYREKELDFLKKLQDIQTKEAELELELQRKLNAERELIKQQIQKEELERISIKDQEHQLKVKELEKQIEDQRKLAEEMRRKAEQGSMQMQGEVQELLLEELLKASFPFDLISEVGKGVRGADCIQTVRNNIGQEAGKIIYESKRTTAFAAEWIEKLKADMQEQEKYISDSTIEKTHLKIANSKLLNEKTQCETAYASLYAQNNIIDTKYNALLQKLKEQFQLVGTSFTSFSDSYKNHSRTLHPDKLESFKEKILTNCANVPDDFVAQFNIITVLSTRIAQLLIFLRDNNY